MTGGDESRRPFLWELIDAFVALGLDGPAVSLPAGDSRSAWKPDQ